jgi:hypothetical protein
MASLPRHDLGCRDNPVGAKIDQSPGQLKMLSTQQLRKLAARYVWWLPPEETLRQPYGRLLLQVMRYATWEDAQAALQHFGADAFKEALLSASAGALDPRSWNFWYLYLRMANAPDDVPPMPTRKLEDAS